MESSEDVINCTNLAVSLSTVISEPAVDMTPVAQPLGGDTGPGKAFRQVSSCRYAVPCALLPLLLHSCLLSAGLNCWA